MPKTAKPRNYSSSQAAYVLETLVAEKRLSHGEIDRVLAQMPDEILAIERRLAHLKEAVAPAVAPLLAAARKVRERLRPAQKSRKKTSARNASSQQLQGRYLGYIRQIPERERKRFKEIAKSDGRETAITAMKKRLGK